MSTTFVLSLSTVVLILLGEGFRRVDAVASTCEYPASWASYPYKGVCSKIYQTHQVNTADTYVNIFDPSHTPDMLTSDATLDVLRFTVWPTPMCHPLVASLGSSGLSLSSSLTYFELTNVKSVATYKSVIDTIQYRTCPNELTSARTRLYDFVWEMFPSTSSFRDPINDELHFYIRFTLRTTWATAKSLCEGMVVFGLRGYLISFESRAESDAFIQINGWFCLYLVAGQWTNLCGPHAGFVPNFPGVWWPGSPDNAGGNQVAGYFYGYDYQNGWEDDAGFGYDRMYQCEFGGTTPVGGKSLRGSTRLTVRSSECDFGARSTWSFPGTCHTMSLSQRVGTTQTTNLFTSNTVRDMKASYLAGISNAQSFTVTVSPNLCQNFAVTPGSGVTVASNGPGGITLTGTVSPNAYWTVLQTLQIATCLRDVPTDDKYTIMYELTPVGTYDVEQEGTYGFRGVIQLSVLTTSCDVGPFRYYAFPGVCHAAFDAQTPGATTTRNIFTTDVVPDLITSDAYNAKGFALSVSPALCTSFGVAAGSLNVANSNSGLSLSNVASVTTYSAVIRTISMTSCARTLEMVDEYTFHWYLEPDLATFVMPGTIEPHFYEKIASTYDHSSCMDACEQRSVFGLRGYLATVTSVAENSVIISLSPDGFLAATNVFRNNEFYWVHGPEAGWSLRTFSFWQSGQPGGSWNSGTHYPVWIQGAGPEWQDTTGNHQCTCEYGGTPGAKAFRGTIRLDIRTSPCDFQASKKWGEKGSCHVHTTNQALATATTQKVFPQQAIDEMTTESATYVSAYGVWLATPMCAKFTVTLPSGATLSQDSTTEYWVTHSAPAATAQAMFSSMYFTSCPRAVHNSVDVYHVQWQMVPELTWFTDVHTAEPRYAKLNGATGDQTWENARYHCEHVHRPFGMVGYLMSVPELAQSGQALKTLTTSANRAVHFGLSDQRLYGVQQWYGGPLAGTFWTGAYTGWNGGQPSHDQSSSSPLQQCATSVPGSLGWDDSTCTTHVTAFACAYSGLPGFQTFRGIVKLQVRSSACSFGGTQSVAGFQGACHTVSDMWQTPGATTTRNIFTTDVVPDLITSDAYNAKGFALSVSPALCTSFGVAAGSLNVANSNSGLSLSNVASVTTYSAVIRTISMTSCARQNPVTDAFVITWELEPDTTTALINGERHFYEYVGTTTDFVTAAHVCTTRSIFGLTGYLANSVDATDNAAISTALGGNAGWIGIGEFVRWSTWRVASGPEMTQLATYAPWKAGEPDHVGYVEHATAMQNGVWMDVPTSNSMRYVCEYGGTLDGTKMFRGTTKVVVTTTRCAFSTRPSYVYKGTCVYLNDVSQKVSTTTSRSLFASIDAPELMSTDAYNGASMTLTPDNALCAPLTLTPSGGLTAVNSVNGLTLTGVASVSVYKTNLQTITMTTCQQSAAVHTKVHVFTWALFPAAVATVAFPEPHYYNIVTASASGVSQANAALSCAQRTLFGMAGYLATITTAAENSVVRTTSSSSNTWLGATDLGVDGTWRWVSGPERGLNVVSAYTNWDTGASEPDGGTAQNAASLIGASGLWRSDSQSLTG